MRGLSDSEGSQKTATGDHQPLSLTASQARPHFCQPKHSSPRPPCSGRDGDGGDNALWREALPTKQQNHPNEPHPPSPVQTALRWPRPATPPPAKAAPQALGLRGGGGGGGGGVGRSHCGGVCTKWAYGLAFCCYVW